MGKQNLYELYSKGSTLKSGIISFSEAKKK